MRIIKSAIFAATLAGLFLFATASAAPPSPNKPPTATDFPVGPPPFVVPAGGSKKIEANGLGGSDVKLLNADGSLYARQVSDGGGRVLDLEFFFSDKTSLGFYASYVTRPSRAAQRRSRFDSWCGFDGQNQGSNRWFTTMNWYWNQASTPGNLDLTNTLNGLRSARIEWESNVNWCFIPDNSAMNFNYQGITTLSYGHNGVNTVGWGDISQTGCTGSGVAACTRVEASSGTITEADTRMDASGTWSNVGASNAADVQSVMAHESGHAIGFGHVTDSSEVMYTPIFLGDTSDRKLGMGDADEDNLKY